MSKAEGKSALSLKVFIIFLSLIFLLFLQVVGQEYELVITNNSGLYRFRKLWFYFWHGNFYNCHKNFEKDSDMKDKKTF
jgi:hypothetical protein